MLLIIFTFALSLFKTEAFLYTCDSCDDLLLSLSDLLRLAAYSGETPICENCSSSYYGYTSPPTWPYMRSNVAQTPQTTSTEQQYKSSKISSYRYGPAQQSYSASSSESHYGQKQRSSYAYSSSDQGYASSSGLSGSIAQTTQAAPIQKQYNSPKSSSYSNGIVQRSYGAPSSENHYGQKQQSSDAYSSSGLGYTRISYLSTSTAQTTQAAPVHQPYNSLKISSYRYGPAQQGYSAPSAESPYGQKQQTSNVYSSSDQGYASSSSSSSSTAQTTQATPVQQYYNSLKISNYRYGPAQRRYNTPSLESHYGQPEVYSSSSQGYNRGSDVSSSTAPTAQAAPAQQPHNSPKTSSHSYGTAQRSYSASSSESHYGQKKQSFDAYSSSGLGYTGRSYLSTSTAQTTQATPAQQSYNTPKISSYRYGPVQRSYSSPNSENHYGQNRQTPDVYSSSGRGYTSNSDSSSETAQTTQAAPVQQPYNSPKISSYSGTPQQSYGAPSSENRYGQKQQTSDVYSSSSKGYAQSSNYVLKSPPVEQARVEQSYTHTLENSYKVPSMSYSQRTQEYGVPSETSYARKTQMQTSPPLSSYKAINEPSPSGYARPALLSYARP
ncbi:hypothetical protein V3C99_014014 [Haemonchus contortus]